MLWFFYINLINVFHPCEILVSSFSAEPSSERTGRKCHINFGTDHWLNTNPSSERVGRHHEFH